MTISRQVGRRAWWIASLALMGSLATGCGSEPNDQRRSEDASQGAVGEAMGEGVGEAVGNSSALLAQGDSVFHARDYATAGEIYQRAVAVARDEGHRSNQVEALAQVARSFSIRGLGEEGRPWLQRAESLATREDPAGWSRYQLVKGVFQREDGRREDATDTFARLYDFCRENELYNRAVNAAHMAAISAEPEEQIAWGLKGIRAAEEGGYEAWLGPLWNNLGWTYADLGRPEDALDALTKARDYHHKTGDELSRLIADWSVAHALRMVGRLDEAAEWTARTLEWAERRYTADPSPANAEWVGLSRLERAEIALAQERPDEARGDFLLALEKLREAGMQEWDAQRYQSLRERYASMWGAPVEPKGR